MKKYIILTLLLFAAGLTNAQQTFTTTAPGTSVSLTERKVAGITDSLNSYWFGDGGNKFYWIYTAAQQNLRFLKKSDTSLYQTVLNFFPKGDTRWLKATTAASLYASLAGNNIFTGNNTFTGQTTLLDFLNLPDTIASKGIRLGSSPFWYIRYLNNLGRGVEISTSGEPGFLFTKGGKIIKESSGITKLDSVVWHADLSGYAPISGGGYYTKLAPTAEQTSTYTATANDLVKTDATSGTVAITLPNAPANGTLIAVKMVKYTSPYTTTVTCGGSDVYNKSGGSTVLTLSLLNQGVVLHYSSGIWYVLADDLPLAQLDSRYPAVNPLYGVIYKKSTWSNLSDFTVNGATASVSSGNILVNSTGNNRTHSLDMNWSTLLDRWRMSVDFIVPTVNINSHGMGIGLRSANSAGEFYAKYASINLDNTGSGGTFNLLGGQLNGGTILATSAVKLTYLAGDTLRMSIERQDNYFALRVLNLSRPQADVSISYMAQSGINTGFSEHNTGSFSIVPFQTAAITVKNITITSNILSRPDIACMGDSKMQGGPGGITAQGYTVPALLSQYYNTVNFAGGGDATVDVMRRLPEVVAIKPKYVILDIGRNDQFRSVALDTIKAHIVTITNTLTAAGIVVLHPTGWADNAINFAAMAAWIRSTYPTTYIETFIPLTANTSSVWTDNVHPTNLAAVIYTNQILTSGLLTGLQAQPPRILNQQDLYKAIGTDPVTVPQLYVQESPLGATTDSVAVKLGATGKMGAVPATNFVASIATGVQILANTQTTLVAGTKALSVTGVTTGSHAQVTLVSYGGTVTTTAHYAAVCTLGTVTVTALTNAGATDATDTSILNVFVTN